METARKIGGGVGFVLSCIIFTTTLFFVLHFLNKMPVYWSFFEAGSIALSVIILGFLLKKYLS